MRYSKRLEGINKGENTMEDTSPGRQSQVCQSIEGLRFSTEELNRVIQDKKKRLCDVCKPEEPLPSNTKDDESKIPKPFKVPLAGKIHSMELYLQACIDDLQYLVKRIEL